MFSEAKNWIFLKKDLSLEIVLGKTAGKHAVALSIKIVMAIEMCIAK